MSRRADRDPQARSSRWLAFAALLSVLLSLVALSVVPIWVNRTTNRIRNEVQEVLDPARELTVRVHAAIADQVAHIRGFVLSGDPDLLEVAKREIAIERDATRRLEPLARQLGPAVESRFDTLRARADRWRQLTEALIAGEVTAAEFVRRLPEQQPLYEATTGAVIELALELDRVGAEYRAAMIAAQRRGARIIGVLVILALLAALSTGWLYWRQGMLVAALDRSRGEAVRLAREEAALREAAAALGAPVTTAQVVDQIAQSAVIATGADHAFVERFDRVSRELEVVAVAGSRVPRLGTRVAYEGSHAERAIESGRTFIFDQPEAPVLRRLCAACTFAVVPLAEPGERAGVLVLVREPYRPPFQPDEVDRAVIFGGLAALAIRKANILEVAEHRREELERVTESRARLMRGFSHDMKNPLGAADGHLQLIEMGARGEVGDEQREAIGRARRSIREALNLIDDLMTLARAEAGQIEIVEAPVDISEVTTEVAEEHRARARGKDLELEVELPDRRLSTISDPARIRQILGNLVSNAVKFTPSGGRVLIRAAVRRGEGAPGAGPWVAVEVADTGPGIPPEEQEKLFQEFQRIATVPGERGAGIGLAISQRLARALGGLITVDSEVGRGSTFTLWLPLRRAATPARRPEAAD